MQKLDNGMKNKTRSSTCDRVFNTDSLYNMFLQAYITISSHSASQVHSLRHVIMQMVQQLKKEHWLNTGQSSSHQTFLVIFKQFTCWPSLPECRALQTQWTADGLWFQKLLCCFYPQKLCQVGAMEVTWRRLREDRRSAHRAWQGCRPPLSARTCSPPRD